MLLNSAGQRSELSESVGNQDCSWTGRVRNKLILKDYMWQNTTVRLSYISWYKTIQTSKATSCFRRRHGLLASLIERKAKKGQSFIDETQAPFLPFAHLPSIPRRDFRLVDSSSYSKHNFTYFLNWFVFGIFCLIWSRNSQFYAQLHF